ncbi:tlr0246 [Thermosynechococcus vestitus BP-1]|uniref:Tlr0246 protein n=2 Tax=Thermosynechococcus vestitus TaxID=146786 RepID=Q8DM77_THEVB|nr:tlr0246 [Thermosynechococcus vestitus BP-1]
MKVLILTRYESLGASSRVRFMQYLPLLQEAGIEALICPLLNDGYIQSLYSGSRPLVNILSRYWKRILDLLRIGRFDILWIEKELFPWLPDWIEKMFLQSAPPFILDFDDAIFHNYDQSRSILVNKLLGRKIDSLMKCADLVMAGNPYIATRAIDAGAKKVVVVPTVVDLKRYDITVVHHDKAVVTIGWIGSPSTANYLHIVQEPLRELSTRYSIRCVAIGARREQLLGTPFEPRPWAEKTEASELAALDIGIMPLPDAPWERGKCGYKLIQYMACGLPVVASPVGVNCEIVEHGVNGFLASTDAEWRHAIETLINDADLRSRMGAAGRRKVEHEYSLQVWGDRVAELFLDVAKS